MECVDTGQDPNWTPSHQATRAALQSRDQPVMVDDLRILQRAAEILREESAWNRHDDRVRGEDHTNRRLICALHEASIERVLDLTQPGRMLLGGATGSNSECDMHPAEGCFVRRPDFADPGATTFSLYRPGPGARDRQGGAPGASS